MAMVLAGGGGPSRVGVVAAPGVGPGVGGARARGRCGLSCVAFVLARWLGQAFDAARERLRDWYCGAGDKTGRRRRRDLDVEACFAPLLAWVLRDWAGPADLAVALDATTLGERFV